MDFEKIFDFNNTSNMLATMTQAANQQAAEAKEFAEIAAGQKQKVADSAARYDAEAQKSLTKLQTVQAKGEEARSLAESNNPFDRITLIGEQILNPRDYTADGRSRQISEQSQQLAAHGQIFNVENNLAQANIDAAQARFVANTAGSNAQMNLMRAHVEGLQLMSAGMQATETMRQQNLAMADLPTLLKVQATPPDPKLNGKIAMNGMTYTPGELKERQTALETREKLAFLTPQATDPKFAQAMNIVHDMSLSTMSRVELENLRNNGYIMPDGTQVQSGIFDANYQRVQQREQQAFELAMNQSLMENQVPMMMQESQAMAKNVGMYAAPGTPLAVANQNFLAAANGVAAVAAQDQTPEGKIRQVGVLTQAQKQLNDAVDKEATRKAAGDKELASIYRSQILGMPVQASQVEDVMRSRYISNKGFGELLPNDVSNRLRDNADREYNSIKVEAAKDMTGMEVKFNDKQIREQAINRAIEVERQSAGVVGINLIQQNVGNRTDSPAVKAGMIGGQIFEMQQRASKLAWDSVAQREKLSPDKVIALKNGKAKDVGISDEKAALINQQVNVESVMAEYDLFDKQKPGLGYEMQQWYAATLPEMAKVYTSNLPGIQQAMTGDSVLVEAQKLASMYTMADESVTQRGQKMMTELVTGIRKPEGMWPVLLQNSPNLQDPQKQSIYYDVVLPAIQQARARGANDDNATEAAFAALNNYKSDDAVTMTAVKTLMRSLPTQLEHFQTTWGVAMDYRNTLLRANKPDFVEGQLRKTIPWMK